MKESSPTQVLAACGIVALLAVWSVINFYGTTEEAAGPNADVYKVAEQNARFQDLMPALPKTGIIGYVSDVPTSQTLGAVLRDGAQYALAPRLVRAEREPRR
jgi:hypothetical protein